MKDSGKTNSKRSKSKKKKWPYDALLKAMQPTPEELEYRQEKSKDLDFLQNHSQSFKCTKCQVNFKPIIVKHEKVPTHPCLGVLMCQKCCDYYEDGEFSLDSDGEDKYCRWCGEGGTIFSCSKCISGFCTVCIKQHFKLDYFKKVQKDENWLCFFCDPKPLWDQRLICSLATKLSENLDSDVSSADLEANKDENDSDCQKLAAEQETVNADVQKESKTKVRSSKQKQLSKNRKKNENESPSPSGSKNLSPHSILKNKRRRLKPNNLTSSSDESDKESTPKKIRFSNPLSKEFPKKKEVESFERKKPNVMSEVKKILALSKHQMELGVNWSNNTLEALQKSENLGPKELLKECQKIKWFLSTISTYLLQFSNSINFLEKTLHNNDSPKSSSSYSKSDHLGYTNILQFLGFVKNQVKTFMDKGISFPDIFEAEVYDDEKVIGLMKKSKPSSSKDNNTKTDSRVKSKTNCKGSNIEDYVKDQDLYDSESSRDGFLVIDEKFDTRCDMKDDDKGCGSSNATSGESSQSTAGDPREDIREILAILENA